MERRPLGRLTCGCRTETIALTRTTLTFIVLFVCSANVCRSPTAMLLTSRGLSRAGVGGIELQSAGVAVVSVSPWCREARAWVESGEDEQRLRLEHEARQLDRGRVDRAGLILAADLSVHEAILAISPTSRARLFTIREAAVLSGAVVKSVRSDGLTGSAAPLSVLPMPVDTAPERRLSWLVEEMNAARGQVALPAEPPRWRPFRKAVERESAFDIPDAHGVGGASHNRALRTLDNAVQAWTESVVYACERVPAP